MKVLYLTDGGVRLVKKIIILFLKKANGEYSHQYKVIAEIIGMDLENKTTTVANYVSDKAKSLEEQINKYLSKGKISKKEYNRIAKLKKDFPQLADKFKNLKELLKKK